MSIYITACVRQRLQRITYGVCCVLIFGSVLVVFGSLHVGEMEADCVVVEADEGFSLVRSLCRSLFETSGRMVPSVCVRTKESLRPLCTPSLSKLSGNVKLGSACLVRSSALFSTLCY